MKPAIRYEDAAEPATVSGWRCKGCGSFWHGERAEHAARWCCGYRDQPCECGGRINGSWTCCADCRNKKDIAAFAARERRPWDGKQMIYSEQADRYFDSPDDFDDWNECRSKDEGDNLDRETARLVLCEPSTPSTFDMAEFLHDDLGEDMTLDTDEIDKIVNDWIEAQGVLGWFPGKYALAAGS